MEPGNSTYLDTYAWVLFMKERYLEAKYIIERAIDNGGDVNDVIVEHYGDILFGTSFVLFQIVSGIYLIHFYNIWEHKKS